MKTTVTVLFALAASAFADVRRDYEWQRPLEGGTHPGSLYRVPVPGEVQARCHRFPHDVRIVDETGAAWPFYLPEPPASEVIREVPASRINESGPATGRDYWRIDLQVAPLPDGGRPLHQRLHVPTSGSGFIRLVEVYGSDDQQTWGLLSRGYLVSTDQPRHLVQDRVDYPLSNLPHLQIRIYPNARNATEEFAVGALRVQRVEAASRPLREVPLTMMEVDKSEEIRHAQVLLADTGFENHPLHRLRLAAPDADYARPVDVFLRNRPDEPWRRVASASIQRAGGAQVEEVRVLGSARFIKCAVYHYDDPPLEGLTLTAHHVGEELVVEAREGREPILYYGGEFADAPRFDLAARVKAAPVDALPLLNLGDTQSNAAFRQKGFGSLGPWLAGLAVGLVSLLVVWVIIGMLPKRAGA